MKFFSLFKKKQPGFSFRCSCCGKTYDEVPLSFDSEFPDYYFTVPIEERSSRIELEDSVCIIDKEHFFHRGRLIIPITDHPEDLTFHVWTSISRDNFNKRMDLWEDPDRVEQAAYFGWLQTIVPTYGNTINIKTIACEQKVGLVPLIKVTEDGHPLTIDQKNGISYTTALEKVETILKEYHQG
jgi:hypothetical protein